MKLTTISWATHTFNPWWGCVKVSPACANCYAASLSKRMGHKVWGKNASRRLLSDDHWKGPILWNKEAEARGQRARVFCASMADVFEDRPDVIAERKRLLRLIEATPWLDWLLLTKRPENVMAMVPWGDDFPDNVWIGVTAENQKYVDVRIPILLEIPAKVHFLSCEPLLGPLDLSTYVGNDREPEIHWVIAGGESGGNSRPMSPRWVSQLKDECVANGIAFHFKQWGNWAPLEAFGETPSTTTTIDGYAMGRGKKAVTGRLIDGQIWDQVPEVRVAESIL